MINIKEDASLDNQHEQGNLMEPQESEGMKNLLVVVGSTIDV